MYGAGGRFVVRPGHDSARPLGDAVSDVRHLVPAVVPWCVGAGSDARVTGP